MTTIHVLLYGKTMSSGRFQIWKAKADSLTSRRGDGCSFRLVAFKDASSLAQNLKGGGKARGTTGTPREASIDGRSDILVLQGDFACPRYNLHDNAHLRDVLRVAFKHHMTICTDVWLQHFFQRIPGHEPQCRNKGTKGYLDLRSGDVTRQLSDRLQLERNRKKQRTAVGSKEAKHSSLVGCGVPQDAKREVICLDCSDSDDDDDITILGTKKLPNDIVPGKVDGSNSTILCDPNEDMDDERRGRLRNRIVQPFPAFHASWLRGLKGHREAKAKARKSSSGVVVSDTAVSWKSQAPRDLCQSLSQAEFLDAEPEQQVYWRATTFMRKRKESGLTWKYAFEECFDRAQRDLARAKSPTAVIDVDRSPEKRSKVDDSWNRERARNKAIAKRLRSIVSAQAALNEIRSLTGRGRYSIGGEESEDDSGVGFLHPAMKRFHDKKRFEVAKSQQSYRELTYEKVARTVEHFPTAVTLASLSPKPPGKKRRKGQCTYEDKHPYLAIGREANAATPNIECGGSVRDRLIRAILLADRHPILVGDPDHLRDESVLNNRDARAIDELRQIWGVGLRTAARIVSYGVYSIEQLRNDPEVLNALNRQQLIGLSRYEDLLERIPRDEVHQIWQFVSNTVESLSDHRVSVTACGSYRRGANSCGDVDLVLLPNKNWCDPKNPGSVCGAPDDAAVTIFDAVLTKLREENFLTDDLTVPNMFGENSGPNPGTDSLSYMGVCRLPDSHDRKYRRVDIKAYPGCQGAFALLYFTGDAHFNRSMRAFAKKAGLTLSDAGLACCDRRWKGKKSEKTKVYESVSCASEQDIFAAMGIGYVAPSNRGCHGNGNIENNAISKQKNTHKRRWDHCALDGFESESDSE